MGPGKILSYVLGAIQHPNEFRALVHRGVWYDPPRRPEDDPEASGLNRKDMVRCWELLDATSRSFAAVIKELEGELCRVICLFYLVLRGLDTIEDDMTLDINVKADLLRNFYKKLSQPGWNFKESGPNEKDRQLLVEFDVVIKELMLLDSPYLDVITRICKNMGRGMALYALEAEKSTTSYAVNTLVDHDMYCHYVAGLVGEGLSQLWSASGKEGDMLGKQLTLSNSMGLMLQKVNITRDFREDLEDGRFFWPKEIWGKYAEDPKRFYAADASEEMKRNALYALNEMVADALAHAPDCLNYLSLLKNQSIFNFCAIPQVMAIASLELVFNNPEVFKRNVKIRKGQTCQLINRATNPRDVAYIFLEYARKIHKQAVPSDPSFVKVCVSLGQIEQWCENRYPSWMFNEAPSLKQLPVYQDDENAKMITDARVRQLPKRPVGQAPLTDYQDKLTPEEKRLLFMFLGGLALFFTFVVALIFFFVFYLSGSTPKQGTWLGSFFHDSVETAHFPDASATSLAEKIQQVVESARVEL